MPSPFPGMAPFIEAQAWSDFHHELISSIREALTPGLRPRYIARVEERIYIERHENGRTGVVLPDVSVLQRELASGRADETRGGTAVATAVTPVTLTLPMPERVREAFVAIRGREAMEVIATIEVLSPGNKRTGSDGRREYLEKRGQVLQSDAHLVEVDLLRAGERLPTMEPLPPADYYAFVSRGNRRPKVVVYPWTLRHPLPTIPIPLVDGDPDLPLDLQAVFTTVYDRAGYDYSLDYHRPPEPQLSEGDAAWSSEMLAAARL